MDCLRPGGDMVFSIRDIYLDSKTDSGMNFHGALAKLVEEKKLKKIK